MARSTPRTTARVAPSARTGYSGKQLHAKLGIQPGMAVALLGAPQDYFTWLELAASEFRPSKRLTSDDAIVHVFVRTRAELSAQLTRVLTSVGETATAVWVSWPKGGRSDVKEDHIRAMAPTFGWVDVKVCSVSDEWSGLKLMRRRTR